MAQGLAKLMAAVVHLVLLLMILESRVTQADCPDKKALSDIPFYLNVTGLFTTWTPTTVDDCCTKWEGVQCGSNNRTTWLTLVANYSGPNKLFFPPSIFDLTYLEVLQIGDYLPTLEGNISSDFSQLNNLKFLVIVGTGIGGIIPAALGNMKALQIINLSKNKINGGVENLAGKQSKVFLLDLSSNDLSGLLPTTLPSKLEELKLANNKYAGEINPVTAQKWSSIKFLDVSDNQITGTLEYLLQQPGGALQSLKIAGNQLYFNMTAINFTVLQNLTVFDVSRNQIYWLIPDSVNSLKKLVSFVVNDNLLLGPIPSSLANQPAANFANNFCLCDPPLPKCKEGCFSRNTISQLLYSYV